MMTLKGTRRRTFHGGGWRMKMMVRVEIMICWIENFVALLCNYTYTNTPGHKPPPQPTPPPPPPPPQKKKIPTR